LSILSDFRGRRAPVSVLRLSAGENAARESVFRSFTNADAIADARAEVPVEFAKAEASSGPDEQNGNENGPAADFTIGALLFSLFSSSRSEPGEMVREMIPQNENE